MFLHMSSYRYFYAIIPFFNSIYTRKMMARELLTISEIQKAQPSDKEYLLNDGANLYLKVLPSGTKSFFFIAQKSEQGKKIAIKKSLGKFPQIALAQARLKAQKERERLEHISINETNAKFGDYFLKYLETKKVGLRPSSISAIETCYKNYYSAMAQTKLYKITRKDILNAISPLIKENKASMLKTALSFLSGFFDYSIQFDRINENPVKKINIKVLLPNKKAVKHHPHLKDIKSAIELKEKILRENKYPTRLQALITILYTATRVNETLGARWCEFDLEQGIWTIPAQRMKAKKEFVIPLSTQLLTFLKELRKNAISQDDLLFKSEKGGKISSPAIRQLIIAFGYDTNTLTTHGLRGTLASIANDLRAEHGLGNEIIQASLAHETQNEVAKAYNHSIYFDERKKLLQWWGDKLGNII